MISKLFLPCIILSVFGFTVDASVPEILIRAQCQAQCLQNADLENGRRVQFQDESNLFHPTYNNSTLCQEGCRFYFALKDRAAESNDFDLPETRLAPSLADVRLVCMNLQGNVESPSILATFFIDVNQILPHTSRQVFVVYIRQKTRLIKENGVISETQFRTTDWHPLGIRTEQTFALHKLLPATEYQLKVQTVLANGSFSESSNDVWIRTVAGNAPVNPPVSLTVIRQYVENGKLLALSSWNPDVLYPSCFYHLLWRNNLRTESRSFAVEDRFQYVLDKLDYDSAYTVLIRSLSSLQIPRLESPTLSTSFNSWSCLEANRFDFKICEPGPVLNLSANVINDSAIVQWLKPKYVTVTNEIDYYAIRFRSLPHLGRCLKQIEKNFTIFSNETQIRLNSLGNNCFYLAEICAVSFGGKSQPQSVTFNYSFPEIILEAANMSMIIWSFQAEYLISVPIIVGVIVIVVLMLLRFRPRKTTEERIAKAVDPTWLRLILRKYGKNQFYDSNVIDDLFDDLSPFIKETERLGNGQFGSVWKAECTAHGIPSVVAVKRLQAECLLETVECERHLKNEFRILREKISNHPNIVAFYGVCFSPEMKLVIEYCAEGNLKEYLQQIRERLTAQPQSSPGADSGYHQHYEDFAAPAAASSVADNHSIALIDSYQLLSYARQIAAGMEHLANRQLVHRDLAARNVLVTDNGRTVKVADFGLCREGTIYQQMTNDRVPFRWMAPESLQLKKFTSKSDVWSFGVVLWELATVGDEPYGGVDRLPKPENCSQELYNVMSSCWELNENHRPTFTELGTLLENMLESNQQYIRLDNINADSVFFE